MASIPVVDVQRILVDANDAATLQVAEDAGASDLQGVPATSVVERLGRARNTRSPSGVAA
jgi:hypothetical protein